MRSMHSTLRDVDALPGGRRSIVAGSTVPLTIFYEAPKVYKGYVFLETEKDRIITGQPAVGCILGDISALRL